MQRGRCLLERVEHLRELLDRLVQVVEVQHERGDDPHRDGVLGREERTEPDDERERQSLHELDDPVVDRGDALGADARAVLLVARADELAHRLVGLVERLDHPHAGQALLQRGEGASHAVAHAEVRTARRAPVEDRRDHEYRAEQEDDQRELPAQQQHGDQRADHEDAAHHEHRQALADEVLQRLHVGGHARDEQPGPRAVEETHRHAHDVVEHALAQVEQERLADA